MCIIQFNWLIALYIFISFVRNAIFLIIKTVVSGKNSVIFCFFFRHNSNKSLCKNIFLVSLHFFTSPLVHATPQLPLFPSATTCAVDDFQRFIFGNIRSPNKFTGKPKIASHPKSSQEILKHKSTFTFTFAFTFHTIYPSKRSMAHPNISPYIKKTPL